jgi:hypothetical protein
MLVVRTEFEPVIVASERDPASGSVFKLRMFNCNLFIIYSVILWRLINCWCYNTSNKICRVTNQDECGRKWLCLFKAFPQHLMSRISRPVTLTTVSWMTAVRIPAQSRILLFVTTPRRDLELMHPYIPLVRNTLSCGGGRKRPEREADHTHQYNSDVKNAWSFISMPL